MPAITASCPVNSDHKSFIVNVQAFEQWRVDENGVFVEQLDSDVVQEPDESCLWVCDICGSEAILTKE